MKLLFPLEEEYINNDNIRYRGDYNSPRVNADGSYRGHYGIDYKAPIGSSVYSSGSGKVIFSDYNKTYGNTVIIKHFDGTSTLYAHLKDHSIYNKDDIIKGRIEIGKVGNTGNAKGLEPHLHFEHIDEEGTKLIEKYSGNGHIGIPGSKYRLNPHDSFKKGFFIWHCEEGSNTCSECAEKDGKIFQYGIDEEPPLHPNCNCYVEDIVESDIGNYIDNNGNEWNMASNSISLELKHKIAAEQVSKAFSELRQLIKSYL